MKQLERPPCAGARAAVRHAPRTFAFPGHRASVNARREILRMLDCRDVRKPGEGGATRAVRRSIAVLRKTRTLQASRLLRPGADERPARRRRGDAARPLRRRRNEAAAVGTRGARRPRVSVRHQRRRHHAAHRGGRESCRRRRSDFSRYGLVSLLRRTAGTSQGG